MVEAQTWSDNGRIKKKPFCRHLTTYIVIKHTQHRHPVRQIP